MTFRDMLEKLVGLQPTNIILVNGIISPSILDANIVVVDPVMSTRDEMPITGLARDESGNIHLHI